MSETRAFHGFVAGEGVHFALALWPYDLLLRFGYDLPENEHTWDGKWFDDAFEAAAFDLRSTAAKLVIALDDVSLAEVQLREVVGRTLRTPPEIRSAAEATRRAPLCIDLASGYIERFLGAVAAVIPCCYGIAGKFVLDAPAMRRDLQALEAQSALHNLDHDIVRILHARPGGSGLRSHTNTLYVVTNAVGFADALPGASAREVQSSARTSLAAIEALAARLDALCSWCDELLAHLQGVVASRSEPGPELLERWAVRDWSLLTRATPGQEPGYWPRLG